jgi:glycosyltransferase involved in cell wall biosynthesis
VGRLFWLCLALLGGIHFLGWRRDRQLMDRYLLGEPAPELPARLPRVSVIVAAWNEADDLPRFIESFLSLAYPDRELIVCAGGDDGTHAIAKRFASDSVRVLDQKQGEGQRGAQRKCLAVASGEIIFFTDADCVLEDEPFLRTLTPLCTGEESVVVGRHVPLLEQHDDPLIFYRWCVDSSRLMTRPKPRYIGARDVNGANFATTRAAMAAIGDLREDADTGTDYDMATRLLRAGYQLRYAAHSAVQTRYESSAISYVFQNARWVRSAIVYGFRFRKLEDMVQNLTGGIAGLCVIVLPFLRPFVGRGALRLWWLIVLAYWGKRARYLLTHSRMHSWRLRPVLFAQAMLFSFLDFVAWAMALVQALTPRWRRSW